MSTGRKGEFWGMAERRMFAKSIIDSDAFLDMPITARLLYYDLAMRADDDGFVNSPKKIMRIVGAAQDDLKLLAAKKFIIPFDNGVVVIKHWRIHNYIRKDTYTETNYKEQKALLTLDENKAYTYVDGTLTDSGRVEDAGKVRLGKDSLGKDNNISAEPTIVDSTPEKEIKYADVPSIPLNDGTEWKMPIELYNEYQKAYPALDIKKEVSQMRIWSLSNPTNRKTRRGMTRFVNGWLERSQNKPKKNSNGTDWSNIH